MNRALYFQQFPYSPIRAKLQTKHLPYVRTLNQKNYNTKHEFLDQRHQLLKAEAKTEGFHSSTRRRAERAAEGRERRRRAEMEEWGRRGENASQPSGVQLPLPLASVLPVTLPHLPKNLRNSSNKVKAFLYRYNNKKLIIWPSTSEPEFHYTEHN